MNKIKLYLKNEVINFIITIKFIGGCIDLCDPYFRIDNSFEIFFHRIDIIVIEYVGHFFSFHAKNFLGTFENILFLILGIFFFSMLSFTSTFLQYDKCKSKNIYSFAEKFIMLPWTITHWIQDILEPSLSLWTMINNKKHLFDLFVIFVDFAFVMFKWGTNFCNFFSRSFMFFPHETK